MTSTKKVKEENTTESTRTTNTKTSQHAGRYLIIGTSLAIFNYGLYAILANLVITDNNYLWISSLIATAVTTILAFILHSKITWKERNITKHSVIRFFIWNVILTIVAPFLTQFFSLFTFAYDLAYNIFDFLHIPFTYEFVQSTGAFVFSAIVTTIMNFFFYDKFVFGKTTKPDTSN